MGEADAPRSFDTLPDEVVAPEIREKINLLQSNHKKTAALLAWTIFALAETYGVERMGMLTLTFADHVTEPKEATRRLKSLITGVLNPRYLAWVRVFERQKSGRIHYHLIVILREDIKTGVDFAAFQARDYRSAGGGSPRRVGILAEHGEAVPVRANRADADSKLGRGDFPLRREVHLEAYRKSGRARQRRSPCRVLKRRTHRHEPLRLGNARFLGLASQAENPG